MSTLYVVGTPIGNLEDITLRALRVLKEADLILCEDTRVTRRLLDRYGIETKLRVYNEQKSGLDEEAVLALLEEGKNLALVTDAGMPGISDPGARLVRYLTQGSPAYAGLPCVKIVTIPGPSALTSALSIAGLPADQFLFLGFLPHKKGRETLFKEIVESKRLVVFYESPHRVEKTYNRLRELLGPERKILMARELTKIYEEITDVLPKTIKGEFVILVAPY